MSGDKKNTDSKKGTQKVGKPEEVGMTKKIGKRKKPRKDEKDINIVPFEALFKYVDRVAGGLTKYDFEGASDSTIQKYKDGKWGTGGIATPPGDKIQMIFRTTRKKLGIQYSDYRLKALAMINALRKDAFTPYIDYDMYVRRINTEIIPQTDEQFEEFIESSGLYSFVAEYLSLWDNDRYRKKLPPEKPVVANVSGAVVRDRETVIAENDDFSDHMTQTLTDQETGAVVMTVDTKREICDFSCFETYPLMLVHGPGGQGKSTFLSAVKNLHGKTLSNFGTVIKVPLVNLTVSEVTSSTSAQNILGEYIAAQYPGVSLENSNDRILLLLDGVNEYITSKNRRAVESVTGCLSRLFKEIAKGERPWVSVVVTTREIESVLDLFNIKPGFKILALSGTTPEKMKMLEESCQKNGIPFMNTELGKMSEIPLFAMMIGELIEKDRFSEIKDKYHLLDKFYKVRAEQRLSVDRNIGEYNHGYYLYFYYVILPFFAFKIAVTKNTDSAYFFSNHDIDALMDSLQENGLDRILFGSFLREYSHIDSELPKIDALKLERYLINEEDHIVKWEGNGYRFEHEEWRDYLVTKYLTTCVALLKEKYSVESPRWIRTLDMDFNVGTNVAAMILQSMNMFSEPADNDKEVEKTFLVEGPVYKALDGTIRLLHTAFCFNEDLNIRLTKEENDRCPILHKVFSPLADYLLESSDDDEYIRDDKLLTDSICEILSKEAEYHRRNHDYAMLERVIKMAKRFDSDSNIILQQEAKLYLCYYQSLVCHEENITVPESLKGLSENELYERGKALLKRLVERGFYLSANTLGILQTNPAPVLVYHQPDLGPDYCAAFGGYMNVIYGAGYVRRDVAYTVRQAIGLLMKYVRISDDSQFNPENPRSKLANLKYELCEPYYSQSFNQKTVDFIQKLLKKAEGQEMPYLNYLRGCAALMIGKAEKAKGYFENPLSEESELLYLIRRKYSCGVRRLEYDIDKEYEAILAEVNEKGLGVLDKIHPVYTYLEARQTELMLIEDQIQREVRRQRLMDMERKYAVEELVEKIYSVMMK